jgi:RNA polymerase sigma-70 factor (ECF subfamily)
LTANAPAQEPPSDSPEGLERRDAPHSRGDPVPVPGPAAAHNWVLAALERYESPLLAYACSLMSGDLERARDLVQEVFLRLCEQRRDRVEQFVQAWLYRVCRNLAIEARRKDKRLMWVEDARAVERVSPDPSPGANLEHTETEAAALRELEALPENQREVLRLKFGDGLSYRQIAEVTDLSVSNVGVLIHTGLKALRRRLSD